MTYTREQIMQMDTEQLRVAIAEAKGWYRFRHYKNAILSGLRNDPEYGVLSNAVPNWPTSIADADPLIDEIVSAGYHINLLDSMSMGKLWHFGIYADDGWLLISASGKSRAEAISRAYLMWRNEEQRESD